MNKVVARYADGRLVKGMTADFVPARDIFHVTLVDAQPWDPPVEVHLKELKALFFVKDFAGNPKHKRKNDFDPLRPPPGRKIQVKFNDGEVLVGTTTGYMKGRPGFFLVPADTDGNTERCYVVAAAAREISFIR